MKTSSFLAAAVLLMGLPLASQAEAAIPMFNGTCPGGLDVHANDGGPVYVNGKETQLKRFNDNYFEARDSDSGVTLSITRSADGGVQMSYTGRHGANGVCSIRNSGPHDGSHASFNGSGSGSEVTCESQSNDLAECDMNTQGNVEIVRQLSRTQCVEAGTGGFHVTRYGSRTDAARFSVMSPKAGGITRTTDGIPATSHPSPSTMKGLPSCSVPATFGQETPVRWSPASL